MAKGSGGTAVAAAATPEPKGGNVATYARYTGDGSMFIAGAPARNLTREEWDALDRQTQALCLAAELYVLADEPAQEG